MKKVYMIASLLVLLLFLAPPILWSSFPRRDYINMGIVPVLYFSNLGNDLLEGFKHIAGPIDIKVISRGSGELLRLLSEGSICIALTALPEVEAKLSSSGKIEWLGPFAYTYLVLVGPHNDPANVSSAIDLLDAFKRIYIAGEIGKVKFISRGDNSTTHIREKYIWKFLELKPEGKTWYIRTGQGPYQTLLMADNMEGYVWIDINTYKTLSSQGRIKNVKIIYESAGEPLTLLLFSISISNHEACKNFKDWGLKFRDYVMGPAQTIIEEKYSPQGFLYTVKGREGELRKTWEVLAKLGG